MVCTYCGGKTRVVNSRAKNHGSVVWRRRQCDKCSALFTTKEILDHAHAWLVRSKEGRLEPFLNARLLVSLHESLKHRPEALKEAEHLTSTVHSKLKDQINGGVIDATSIKATAIVVLNRFDKAAATHYRAYHP